MPEIRRIEIKADKETQEKIEIIKKSGAKDKTTAIILALYHYAAHVEAGDFGPFKDQD